MSGEVQTARLEAGLVVAASRAELKSGVIPSAHHVLCNPDMVLAVCRAMTEKEGDINHA